MAQVRSRRTWHWLNLPGLAAIVVILGIWQLLESAGTLPSASLPSPVQVARHLGTLFTSTNLGDNVLHTVEVTLLGWVLASAAGVVIGLALGLFAPVWRWSMTTVDIFRGLPAIAFLPVAVLWLGLTSKMELVVVVYAAMWPVALALIEGLRDVKPVLIDVTRTLQLRRRETIVKVLLPSAAGPLIVGLRLALTISLVLSVVAEMVANPTGLGYQLVFEKDALQPALMIGCLVVIGLLALSLNAAFTTLARWIAPGITQVGSITRKAS